MDKKIKKIIGGTKKLEKEEKSLLKADKARDKVQSLLDLIETNDYGESGLELTAFVDKSVASKLVEAYSSLEDLYGYAEDLELAP